jgi:hypothetical protein
VLEIRVQFPPRTPVLGFHAQFPVSVFKRP